MDGGLRWWQSLGTLAIIALLTVLPLKAVGAESQFNCGSIPCDDFSADPTDKPSLQRGVALYANYCMGCHSLQYSRYNRVARDLGVPEDLYKANLLFDPEIKIGSLMDNAMDKNQRQGMVRCHTTRLDAYLTCPPAGVAVHVFTHVL